MEELIVSLQNYSPNDSSTYNIKENFSPRVYVVAHSGFVMRCCPMAQSLFILGLLSLHI